MSLQVWLPMIRQNEQNQGIFDTTISHHNISLDNSGKIGKCYSFSSSSTYLEMDCPLSSSTPNFTIALWAYVSGIANNYCHIFSSRTAGSGKGICLWVTSAYRIRLDDGAGKTFTYSLPQNTWTHICVVRTTVAKILYVNGVLTDTIEEVGNLSGIGTIGRIGMDDVTSTTFYTIGKMNDFRIYDHALSPREIKEISKGLVLHLPLAAPGGENLIINSRNITTSNYALTRATADGEKITLTPTTSASYLKYKATNVPYGDYKNKTYTVSFYARRISGNSEYTEKGVICYFGVNPTNRINNTLSASYDKYRNLLTINTITNEWKFYSFTATIPDDLTSGVDAALVDTSMITFQLAVSGSGLPVEVIPIKFEIGDHPTPWTPNPADTEYTTMGFNDSIEYDVSGYGYNAEKLGTIEWFGDSPRYNGCYEFNGVDSVIKCVKDFEVEYMKELTVSCWAKVDSWEGTVPRYFLSSQETGGIVLGFSGTNMVRMRTYRYTTPEYGSPGYWQADYSPANLSEGWHFIAGTTGEGYIKLYIDGVLVKTTTGNNYGIHFNKNVNMWIGAEATSTSYSNPFPCWVSDVRVYATALSDEDILALYNTPESLTNTGTLLTQGEFVEV